MSRLSPSTRGPFGRVAQTTPGSRSHTVSLWWMERTHDLGRGVTIAEACEQYAQGRTNLEVLHFQQDSRGLVQRGILLPTEGSSGRTRYAHRDAMQPAHGDDYNDPWIAIMAALRIAHAAACSLAPTGRAEVRISEVISAVNELLAPRASLMGVETIRHALRSMAVGYPGGAPEWQVPWVVCTEGPSPSGVRTNWWRPVDSPASEAALSDRPRSLRDAVMAAALACHATLGRPVTRTEIRWWVDAHRDCDPVARAIPHEKVGMALDSVERLVTSRSSQRIPAKQVIARIRGPLTCYGGPSARLAVTTREHISQVIDDSLATIHVCRLEDAIESYAVADEWDSINRLRALSVYHSAPVLGELAERRTALLARLILDQVVAGDLVIALMLAERAVTVLESWVMGTPDIPRDTRLSRLLVISQRRRGLVAVRSIMRSSRSASSEDDEPDPLNLLRLAHSSKKVAAIGAKIALMTQEDLLPWFDAARDALAWDGKTSIARVVDSARRFVLPGAYRILPSPFAETPVPMSGIDRVDALVSLYRRTGLLGAVTLLDPATAILGHVLRDAGVLREALHALRPGDAWPFRAIVVALGLLGDALPIQDAIMDVHDPLDIEASIFAATLSRPLEAARIATQAYTVAKGVAARAVSDAACARADAGDFFGIVG